MKTRTISTRVTSLLLALILSVPLFLALTVPASAAGSRIAFSVSSTPCQGNLSAYGLPAHSSAATVGQQLYVNLAATSDVKLKTIEAWASLNGGNYTLVGRETANNYIRWAYFPYRASAAGTVTFLVRAYYTNGSGVQGSAKVTVKNTGTAPVNNSGNSARVSLNVPYYMQSDSRWANTKISSKTIGQIGCVVTSVSMIYSYKTGTTVYPDAMKNKLRFSGNDLIWDSLGSLGLSYPRYNTSETITNSMMADIYRQLKAGKPVVVHSYKSLASYSGHAVVVTGYTGTSTTTFNASDFTIKDPLSSSRTTLAAFLNTYPAVYRMIY